jgi:poly(3-hydroxybutyrate) depolymerase
MTHPRNLAIVAGEKTYFTGKPCKNCHTASRFTSSRQCIECSGDKARVYYYKTGTKLSRQRHHANKYGLSAADFTHMWEEQGGCCAICHQQMTPTGTSPTSACVDHCHETNKVRGLLCNHCNRGLGLFKDNKEFLAAAIEYLT